MSKAYRDMTPEERTARRIAENRVISANVERARANPEVLQKIMKKGRKTDRAILNMVYEVTRGDSSEVAADIRRKAEDLFGPITFRRIKR